MMHKLGILAFICFCFIPITCRLSEAQEHQARPPKLVGSGSLYFPYLSRSLSKNSQAVLLRELDYHSVGSGGGIRELKEQRVDFAVSDMPLSKDEQRSLPMPVVQVPIAGEAVVVTYNLPDVKGRLKLTGLIVAKIYLGQIKQWNDPRIHAINPSIKMPNVAITPVYDTGSPRDTFLFTNYLCRISPLWKSKIGSGKMVRWPTGVGAKNGGKVSLMWQTVGSLSYASLDDATRNNLTFCSLLNRNGKFVYPSISTVSWALASTVPGLRRDVSALVVDPSGSNSYPVVGYMYAIVPASSPDTIKRKKLVQLLHLIVGDPQQKMGNHSGNIIPIPDNMVWFSQKLISALINK